MYTLTVGYCGLLLLQRCQSLKFVILYAMPCQRLQKLFICRTIFADISIHYIGSTDSGC